MTPGFYYFPDGDKLMEPVLEVDSDGRFTFKTLENGHLVQRTIRISDIYAKLFNVEPLPEEFEQRLHAVELASDHVYSDALLDGGLLDVKQEYEKDPEPTP